MAPSDEHFAMGLNQGGFILFIVLLVMCFPLCWLPWVIGGFRASK